MVILALLDDENQRNRQKGYNFIKQYRDNKKQDDPIRVFKKYTEDEVNLLAHNYSNFIKYDKVEITEPPATFHLSLEELQDVVDGKYNNMFNFLKLKLDKVKNFLKHLMKYVVTLQKKGFVREKIPQNNCIDVLMQFFTLISKMWVIVL